MLRMAVAATGREEGVERRSSPSSSAAEPTGSTDGAGLSRLCLSSMERMIREWEERSWFRSEHEEVRPRAYAMVGIVISWAMLGMWRIRVWTVSCRKTAS